MRSSRSSASCRLDSIAAVIFVALHTQNGNVLSMCKYRVLQIGCVNVIHMGEKKALYNFVHDNQAHIIQLQ